MKLVEYQPWQTPHSADAGAVERAITAAAGELAMAERWDRDFKTTGFGQTMAEGQASWARRFAYFVVGRIAEKEVCDLDQYLERARTGPRANGTFPEQAYRAALEDYLDHG